MSRWPDGYGLIALAETDSTNAEALRRARGGAAPPFWVTAERQSQGKGRRGNVWQSQSGNLFASLAICPPGADFSQLSFAAALAASDMLASFAPAARIEVKWPNDVLANGRKIVGILLETETLPQSETRLGEPVLVVGIGVNLASHPDKTAYGATSLAALGGVVPTAQVALFRLAETWTKWYGLWLKSGFAPLREAWLARAVGLGAPVTVRLAHAGEAGRGVRNGLFAGLDENGALLLDEAGATRKISAGDVFFI
ncbi:MAG: biotin--[acetyl-CoA-carboxylase] ligase [Rhizomicrobium sp.]